MIPFEVKSMENEEKQPEGYEPRPTWQVWAARGGLVLFILFVIYQLVCISRGACDENSGH